MEPRFNEVAGDRPNLFVKWRVRYIEVLFHTFYCNFGRDIEIISFVISRTSLNRGSLNRGSTVVQATIRDMKLVKKDQLTHLQITCGGCCVNQFFLRTERTPYMRDFYIMWNTANHTLQEIVIYTCKF